MLISRQTVFTMPVFDADLNLRTGFGHYWAVTIPLTLLVLSMWAITGVIPWKQLFSSADGSLKWLPAPER